MGIEVAAFPGFRSDEEPGLTARAETESRFTPSKLLCHREARHDGLQRVEMNIGSTIGVRSDLILQSINVPKLCRIRMDVQEIVDPDRDD